MPVRIEWPSEGDPIGRIVQAHRVAQRNYLKWFWHLVVSPDASRYLMGDTSWMPLDRLAITPPSGALGRIDGMWVYVEGEWRDDLIAELRVGATAPEPTLRRVLVWEGI
jgi:hypothetical protein